MPTGYQNQIHKADPTVNPAGVEAHMRLQYGTLDHLDAATFQKEITLARNTEHLHPGYLREAAEAESMTKDYNHWRPLLTEPPPPPQCLVCGLPAVEMDALSEITARELTRALTKEAAASMEARWQKNPTAGPVTVHLDCVANPERLPYWTGAFQHWTVASTRQLKAHLEIRR